MEPLYLTREQVAALLHCSERTVLRKIDPHFPPERLSGSPLYHRKRLLEWLESREDSKSSPRTGASTSVSATRGTVTRSPSARAILAKLNAPPRASTPKSSRGAGTRAA
jgi:hypothetical protein